MDEHEENKKDLNEPSGVSINGWELTNAGVSFMKLIGFDVETKKDEKSIDT